MQHIQGISRNQLKMGSLEHTITSDNPVRFIDAFVEHIDWVTIGFNPKLLQLEGIRPNYHSISNFRKDNPKDLKQLFKLFVPSLKNTELNAGETIAIDGTKSRVNNSKKANFIQKKIDYGFGRQRLPQRT